MGLSSEKRLSANAAMIMFATLLSRITGFLRTVLIRNIMQPRGYSDEFWVSFSLPDLAFELLVSGAIAAAIIPVLASSLINNDEENGWKAVGTFLNITVIAVFIIEIIFFIWTPECIRIVASGYSAGTEEFALTVKLTRILLPSAVFMIFVGQFNGILNAYNKFAAAAFGPVIYNICVMTSIIAFGGVSAELTAWGVLASSVVYFLIQLACVWKHLNFYKFRLYIKNETFLKLLKLAIPSLTASAVMYINVIISRSFSTQFAQNSVTMMTNANRTWQLPLGIFAQSMGVAILPTLSTRFAEDRGGDYKRVLYKGIRTVMVLCIPCTMVLMLLSRQIMQILFKWSNMPYYETMLNGVALLAYAPALLFQSVVVILNRAFYSIQNTRIPFFCGLCTIAINILINVYLLHNSDMGAVGTALAYVIAVMVNSFLLVILFSKKTGLSLLPDNFDFLARTSVATVVAGIVLWLLIAVIPFPAAETYSFAGKVMEILVVGVQLIFAFIAFVVSAVLLKIEDVRYFIGSILVRIREITGK
ncbi:MAG: murein biosynthesis integral membrane protein MurJ [Clostridiaceae bacterium]|nr:murein biosynthesis integral membrane protein MurJ [Clostridiaceae bacterium]